jgi:hypothetical protein
MIGPLLWACGEAEYHYGSMRQSKTAYFMPRTKAREKGVGVPQCSLGTYLQ